MEQTEKVNYSMTPTTTQQKLMQFLEILDINPESCRTIQAMVEKIQYEAYAEGRRDESESLGAEQL